jgi:serine/threonine protein kinase
MAFSLKDYEITAEIGLGGFASVFRARQKSLSREVAIKRLSPQRTQNASEILQFRREAEAMAALTHDNIIAVFDYAFHNGSYYIVMEYVDGMTFDTALERCVPQECGLFVLEKTAGALRAAHEQNIIHRDIKPANILLGRNGQVKLADFGLALFSTGIETRTSCASPGSVLGTISYMAPESLASPKEVDNRVDVFSLGCILYRLLAGKHPFRGSNFGEISNRILNDDPPRVPGQLGDVAMRCLQKDREKRLRMTELHEALKNAARDGYHEAQEKLIAFVRNDSGCGGGTREPSLASPPSKKRLRSRTVLIASASFLAAMIVAIVLVFHPFSTASAAKKHPASSLPAMPSFSSRTSETWQEHAPRVAVKNGPSPMTATVLDMKAGTLVLKGLTVQDTVFLNSRPARLPAPKPGEETREDTRLELLPGHYRLDIRRENGQAFSRELELVPFERQIIDLKKE